MLCFFRWKVGALKSQEIDNDMLWGLEVFLQLSDILPLHPQQRKIKTKQNPKCLQAQNLTYSEKPKFSLQPPRPCTICPITPTVLTSSHLLSSHSPPSPRPVMGSGLSELPTIPQTTQALSYLRSFAQAAPSAWNTTPSLSTWLPPYLLQVFAQM